MLTIAPAFRGLAHDVWVPANFRVVDREQLLLMPPSLAEWLPEGHLAWFVVDVVEELDLSAFEAAYRLDGRGGAAYPPAMMVAVLVYAYATGERSSRRIERRCVEDVAYRVLAGNHVPDHATIARFRAQHSEALAGLFGQVLVLCERAGVIRAGLLAIDGTKMLANASKARNRTAEQLAKDILAEAEATDAAENETFGDACGDEMPEEMRGSRRKAKLRQLLDDLEAEAAENSYDDHIAERAKVEAETGKRLHGRVPSRESWERRHHGRRHANMTDPESRLQKVRGGFIQGYNAQAAVTEDQFVVAAEVTNEVTDNAQFQPMVTSAKTNLRKAGVRGRVRTVVADAGYWGGDNADTAGIEALIAPGNARKLKHVSDDEAERNDILERVERNELDVVDAAEQLGVTQETAKHLLRRRRRGDPHTLTAMMIAKLDTDRGKRLYKKRSPSVEPVFAQIKHNRGIRTFSRRGLAAVDSEWKLITATHNLLKVWRHTLATA